MVLAVGMMILKFLFDAKNILFKLLSNTNNVGLCAKRPNNFAV